MRRGLEPRGGGGLLTDASTLPCAALTAWSALHDGVHRVGADSKVLVLGSGGVSLFSLILARTAGARSKSQ